MDLGLTGKRALVLASSSGLGFATARQLALSGAHTVFSSRSLDRAEQAAHSVRSEASEVTVHALEVDVANAASLEAAVHTAAEMLSGLDIVVVNAGGPPPGDFQNVSEEQWEHAHNLTLQSAVRAVRYALPHLRAAGGGSITFLGSSSVKQPIPNLLLSNVYRAGVQALSKHLASELAPAHIRVNMISPGRILTDRITQLDQARAEKTGKSLETVREESIATIPMGRLGDPAEFGNVAAFLASPAASYVTGASWFVDGGAVKAF